MLPLVILIASGWKYIACVGVLGVACCMMNSSAFKLNRSELCLEDTSPVFFHLTAASSGLLFMLALVILIASGWNYIACVGVLGVACCMMNSSAFKLNRSELCLEDTSPVFFHLTAANGGLLILLPLVILIASGWNYIACVGVLRVACCMMNSSAFKLNRSELCLEDTSPVFFHLTQANSVWLITLPLSIVIARGGITVHVRGCCG